MAETPITPLGKAKVLLDVFKVIGPSLLAMVFAYGSVRATLASFVQELAGLKREVAELKLQVQPKPTREEFDATMKGLERSLTSIERNVEALRNERR